MSAASAGDGAAVLVQGFTSTPSRDTMMDVVQVSAFENCLAAYAKRPRVHENHHRCYQVGSVVELILTCDGLLITAQLYPKSDLESRVRSGEMTGLSIGFSNRVQTIEPGGTKVISSLRLNEISIVETPANLECRLKAIKAAPVNIEAPDFRARVYWGADYIETKARDVLYGLTDKNYPSAVRAMAKWSALIPQGTTWQRTSAYKRLERKLEQMAEKRNREYGKVLFSLPLEAA